MEQKIIDVVGTMFFKDGKLLIDKPRKRPTYQMIGGSVEPGGETTLQAAIRECHEELGDKAIFDESKFEFVMDFIETATSNPNLKIHMYIYKYDGLLEGELTVSDEIESFMWFGTEDDTSILSNTLKNEIIPYALENGLIFKMSK
jgi:8-oxo-dGTP pyrophosphatase MutT (NUDIX family)